MAWFPGFASHGSSLHLGAGCQQWKLPDVSGTQPPFSKSDAVVKWVMRICMMMIPDEPASLPLQLREQRQRWREITWV